MESFSVQGLIYMFTASFIALFPVMNPISSGFIVNSFLESVDAAHRKKYIKKIITNTLLIGIGSLAAGHLVLLIFGLAVPVIQIGGGIVICKTGWEWLSDSGAKSASDKRKTLDQIDMDEFERKIFYPISFPISIGPGSISVIFTLMATSVVSGNILYTGINYAVIALVICLLCLILYVFLSQGDKITRRLGASGNLVINKLVAFITFCIGLQILLTGVSKAFHIAVL